MKGKQIKSDIRNALNKFRKTAFKNPKVKKRLSVLYHNFQALVDFKQNYKNEIFDYKRIIKGKRHFWCEEIDYGNTYYGHAQILKSYAGYKRKINACIEHGVYFGDTVFHDEAIESGLNGLFTYGDKRLTHLKKVAKVPIVAIGPYIHYAEPLLSNTEIEQIKHKNGKTLLVFPTHSIDRVESEFDYESFNAEIQKVVDKYEISHVIVCLFYKDINIGRDQFYINQGYQVVCNGYRCDPMFLRRLKTFILLSDYTMSNDVGTNVGYCIYLDKPHYIYQQEIKYCAYTDKDMENVMQGTILEREIMEVKQAFSDAKKEITSEQREACRVYWGIDHIRTKDELLHILKGFEKQTTLK